MSAEQQSRFKKLLARRHTLPVQLFLITTLFVIIAEIVLFIPSVAKFRYDWLQERIERAHLASIAFEVAGTNRLTNERAGQIFDSAKIIAVSIDWQGTSRLIQAPNQELKPGLANMQVDLRDPFYPALVRDALYNMISPENAYLLVKGNPSAAPDVTVELFLEKAPLRTDMWKFGAGILGLSLLIAIMVAGGIFVAMLMNFVRPIMKLTGNMAEFQRDPEDSRNRMIPTGRKDEIGAAERVLAEMQQELRSALRQKTRLATLGEGVAKINHDLRNVLASAVLMSDRLAKSDDPRVQKLSPRLISALDKAVAMCKATLDYGRTDVTDKADVNLFDLTEEASEGLKLFAEGEHQITFVNAMPPDLSVMADRTQLFRALFNLARNAAEALTSSGTDAPHVRFSGRRESGNVIIEVEDNGPGVPEEAQANLFVPFKGSKRQGGSGLGLAIAAETIRAHDGDITLKETGPEGTVFRITLPQPA